MSDREERTDKRTETHACDLVSRQAAIDALNTRAKNTFTLADWYQYYLGALHDVADDIRRLPSAQHCITATSNTMVSDTVKIPVMDGTTERLPSAQPEIIRCKDCKNWDTTWVNDYAPNYHYCPLIDGTRKSDFYCADAERRTDG